MVLNLIQDPWIPIRRRDGSESLIAPWQITENFETNPVVAIASPRPDFDGALIQFLIGLIQTTMSPANNREWRHHAKTPPGPEFLKEKFGSIASMFHLGGDRRRFMQELGLPKQGLTDISALLIDAPGDQTLKQNKDIFVKGGLVDGICCTCCATALFTLQTNAPAGGKGHRTSLRGGGPWTTLILGENIWQTAWNNVLDKADFESLGNPDRNEVNDIFPWMGPTAVSENNVETTPEHVSAYHFYWGTPRRIWLELDKLKEGQCDLCGKEAPLVRKYYSRPYGWNYKSGWLHPLSPHSLNKDTTRSPRHIQADGIGYKHWLGLILGDTTRQHEPAKILGKAKERHRHDNSKPLLWSFGYDMDKMKARGWHESIMPMLLIDDAIQEDFSSRVAGLVTVANEVNSTTFSSLRNALFGSIQEAGGKGKWRLPNGLKSDADFFTGVKAHFWSLTEPGFYQNLTTMHASYEKNNSDGDAVRDKVSEDWLKELNRTAMEIFDRFSQTGHFDAVDPQSVAVAWNELRRFTSPNSRKLRQMLMLPIPEKKSGD